jgi:flavin reductase (DIM6/NTAB) family NADH-FMN oxidoreductase RutF
MDGAMIVVTTAHDDERAGCLVGFHGQCSIEPPLYAVWLSVANRTYEVVCSSRYLAVHVLDRADRPVAELFGGTTGDAVDKFALCNWTAGPDGVPLLSQCPNRIVLERVAQLEAIGDHACFVGRPYAAERSCELQALRLSDAADIPAGHPPGEHRS